MPRALLVTLDVEQFERRCRALLLTRSELAARLRFSRTTVRDAAIGKPVGIGTARRLARGLRMSVRELIVKTDEPALGARLRSIMAERADDERD